MNTFFFRNNRIVPWLAAATALGLSATAFAQSSRDTTSEGVSAVPRLGAKPGWARWFPLDLDPRLSIRPASGKTIEPEYGTKSGFDPSLDPRAVDLSPPDFDLRFSLGMMQEKPDAADPTPKFDKSKMPHKSGPVAGHANLAEAATNPTAPLIQFQIQDNIIASSNGANGFANGFTIQPVIPWKMGKVPWITRITFPVVSTPNFGDPLGSVSGLGDTVMINYALFPIKSGPFGGGGSNWGIGPAFTFPTATDDVTGSGKWQAGLGLAYVNTATPRVQWGMVAYQQWSFAGQSDRQGVSKLFMQPVFNVHFDHGLYVGAGDILWSVDWNNNGRLTLPLSVKFGAVTKIGGLPVNLFVEPYYTVGNPGVGSPLWGVKLNITLLFPEG